MNPTNGPASIKNKRRPKPNTTPVRLLKSTAKELKSMTLSLNKKPLGKKARIDDVIVKALSLLEEKHLEEIRESTLSNADKLELSYREYCKANGQISKDEYIGRLLANGSNSFESAQCETS